MIRRLSKALDPILIVSAETAMKDASQAALCVQFSLSLTREYVRSSDDFAFASKFDDVIAWHLTFCQINDCGLVEISYRSILPQKIDNLLCPGRHFSADAVTIDWLNLIPQCVGTGQAAGVAAAVAIADDTGTHDVNIKAVQDILVDQDVPLPRNEKFELKDPTYKECVEKYEYGLYTAQAKKPGKIETLSGSSVSVNRRNPLTSSKNATQFIKLYTFILSFCPLL